MKRKTSSNKTEGDKKYSDTPRKAEFSKRKSSDSDSFRKSYDDRRENKSSSDKTERGRSSEGFSKRDGQSRDFKGKSFDKPAYKKSFESGKEFGGSSERAPGSRSNDGAPNRDGQSRGYQGKSFDKPYKRSSEESSERSFSPERQDRRRSEEGTPKRGDRPRVGFQSKSPSSRKSDDKKSKGTDLPHIDGMPRLNHPNKPVMSKPAPRQTEDIRLNKYISNAGICSRRKADELISKGLVQVNGEVVLEMGHRVQPNDIVVYNGAKVISENKVYVLLNKPKDFITTTADERGRKTVMELVKHAGNGARLYPIGRLDRNTTGLLLLTNDGELAQHLSHPSTNVIKVYQAELDKPIKKSDLETIRNGVELEDGMAQVDEIDITEPQVDARFVGIAIHSGKNRIVRRIFEHLGYEVKRLDRVAYAGLTKKDLPRGKWRFLTEKELVYLKHLTAGSVRK